MADEGPDAFPICLCSTTPDSEADVSSRLHRSPEPSFSDRYLFAGTGIIDKSTMADRHIAVLVSEDRVPEVHRLLRNLDEADHDPEEEV
jgi:hypothetical protein